MMWEAEGSIRWEQSHKLSLTQLKLMGMGIGKPTENTYLSSTQVVCPDMNWKQTAIWSDQSRKYDCDHKLDLKGCLVSILNASQAISLKVLVAFLLTVFLQVRTLCWTLVCEYQTVGIREGAYEEAYSVTLVVRRETQQTKLKKKQLLRPSRVGHIMLFLFTS